MLSCNYCHNTGIKDDDTLCSCYSGFILKVQGWCDCDECGIAIDGNNNEWFPPLCDRCGGVAYADLQYQFHESER